jgi:undecaprenyl-diphosphatase
MIWKYNKRAGVALLVLATLMAIARVFVGAHYPGDVLGGAMLGTLTSVGLAALSARPPMARLLDAIFRILRRWRLAAPPIS